MMLEIYVWSWLHLHPAHVRRKLARFLGLSALILLPLLAMNLALIHRGHSPLTPQMEIRPGQGYYPGTLAQE